MSMKQLFAKGLSAGAVRTFQDVGSWRMNAWFDSVQPTATRQEHVGGGKRLPCAGNEEETGIGERRERRCPLRRDSSAVVHEASDVSRAIELHANRLNQRRNDRGEPFELGSSLLFCTGRSSPGSLALLLLPPTHAIRFHHPAGCYPSQWSNH